MESVGAGGVSAGLSGAPARQRGAGTPPQRRRGAFDQQHLMQVSTAAVTLRSPALPRAAGGAALHRAYST